jgi:Fur family transcriptional regulator, peroxide stress response regulator
MTPDEMESRLRELAALCRARGVPLTIQRRAILRAVLERDDHPTADQVHERVKGQIPGLSRTTVYRVLEMLVDMGLVRQLHHPGASTRYDGKTHRHHHLVCTRCHKVIDVESPAIDELNLSLTKKHGFEIQDYSVHFIGLCATCRQRAAKRQRD